MSARLSLWSSPPPQRISGMGLSLSGSCIECGIEDECDVIHCGVAYNAGPPAAGTFCGGDDSKRNGTEHTLTHSRLQDEPVERVNAELAVLHLARCDLILRHVRLILYLQLGGLLLQQVQLQHTLRLARLVQPLAVEGDGNPLVFSPSSFATLFSYASVVAVQDGKLPASSAQSDKLRSRLSKVEKLLRDESQLKFWLRLFGWMFVTTPLDELELANELSRWIDLSIDCCTSSSANEDYKQSVSQPSSVLELYCAVMDVVVCWGDALVTSLNGGTVIDGSFAADADGAAFVRIRLSILLDSSRVDEMRFDRMPDSRSTIELASRDATEAANVPATFDDSDDGSNPPTTVPGDPRDVSAKPELDVYDTPRK
uniref:Uncharacterized protein n=1 Tax=Anopheles farauti TaxID=69004 RepID=A0A182QVI8_9DIPT